MFCPNCGTKNDANAVKCGQCGFGLKAKADAPKFKGTVMMQGGPGTGGAAPSGTPPAKKPTSPQLKGTMVGVAPPGPDDLRKQTSAGGEQRSAVKRELKGTMVGVAPPGVEEARQMVAAARAQREGAGGSAAQPLGSHMKGTVMGMAAPNFKEGLAGEDARPPQVSAAKAPQREMPSQLKGTMLGVAPPELQEELARVKQVLDARSPRAPTAPNPEFAGTMPSLGAPPEAPLAGAPSPLDATTPAPRVSPFASSPEGALGSASDEAFQQTQISSHPPPGGAGQGFAPPAAPAIAAFGQPGAPGEVPGYSAQGYPGQGYPGQGYPGQGAVGHGPIGQPAQSSAGPELPVAKSQAPLIVLAVLLVLALIGIFVIVGMTGESEEPASEDGAPASKDAAPAKPGAE